jgi:hypothetical protein
MWQKEKRSEQKRHTLKLKSPVIIDSQGLLRARDWILNPVYINDLKSR